MTNKFFRNILNLVITPRSFIMNDVMVYKCTKGEDCTWKTYFSLNFYLMVKVDIDCKKITIVSLKKLLPARKFLNKL